MTDTYQLFIGGEWVDGAGGDYFDDVDPFTGDVFARIAAGEPDDARRAVDAAAEAFPAWAATPPSERRRVLLRAADLFEERFKEVGLLLTGEVGTTLGWGRGQTLEAAAILREAASHVHRVTGEVIPADLPGQFSMTLRQPVGVVLSISPWNVPLVLSMRSIAYPLAYGNSVVLKPSAESAASGGLIIAQILEEAGIPKGVFNVIVNGPGKSGEVGDVLMADPRVRRVAFTGSTAVGRHLAEQAGHYLKRISLELGGNDALIVLADADLDVAVNAAVFGRFSNQGQVCMASKRLIVEEPVVEEFTRRFVARAKALKVGDPRLPDVAVGPIINHAQLDALVAQVDEAVAQGAELLCGGRAEGLCYFPTVLVGVTDAMTCFTEEVFGPVALIVAARDAEHALKLAGDCPYGLSGSVITSDLQKGLELAEKLDTGAVHINDTTVFSEPQAPFGGVKDSGYGKHGGTACIEEFTELKWVTYQKTPREYPI